MREVYGTETDMALIEDFDEKRTRTSIHFQVAVGAKKRKGFNEHTIDETNHDTQ